MISRIRRAIAIALAILVTAVTLGRLRVNWTGGPGAAGGEEDPGRPVATRLHSTRAAHPNER